MIHIVNMFLTFQYKCSLIVSLISTLCFQLIQHLRIQHSRIHVSFNKTVQFFFYLNLKLLIRDDQKLLQELTKNVIVITHRIKKKIETNFVLAL